MKKLLIATIIFMGSLLAKDAKAALFFIDCNFGNNASSGLTTALAWADWDQFTENARAPGDKAVVRRGGTGCDNATNLTVTSTGNNEDFITMEADFDNYWGDFSSSSQTYTVTIGSKQMTASANITGIAAGDWIYVQGDNTRKREFAYEVKSVSGTVLTLYHPYDGISAGAGKTLNVMPDNPQWSTAAGALTATFAQNNWWINGLHFLGTAAGGATLSNGRHHQWWNTIFEGDAAGTVGFVLSTSNVNAYGYGLRIYNVDTAGLRITGGSMRLVKSLIDCDDTGSLGVQHNNASDETFPVYLIDVEIEECVTAFNAAAAANPRWLIARNLLVTGETTFIGSTLPNYDFTAFEDYDSKIGSNWYITDILSTNTIKVASSSNDVVRTGGSSQTYLFTPGASTSDNVYSRVKLTELPVKLNTTRTTFTVYFKPANTASWSADPTSSQLYLEADVLASVSGAFRLTKRSGCSISMTGNSDWQACTLSVTASQSGNAYLRAMYIKPRESVGTSSTDANQFYLDLKPILSQ